MTVCHDVPVLPARVHPSHDMRWNNDVPSGTCEQCLAYACGQCDPGWTGNEALAAACPGRGWWDRLEAQRPRTVPR